LERYFENRYKAVIANSSVPVVFEKMLPTDTVPKSYLENVKAHRKSLSSFVVWLGQ